MVVSWLKKFQLRTSIPDFFTIFQKLRLFPFKYTVERRVVSLHSSTEDFSIPALCEVSRGKSPIYVSTFRPCVKWAVVRQSSSARHANKSRPRVHADPPLHSTAMIQNTQLPVEYFFFHLLCTRGERWKYLLHSYSDWKYPCSILSIPNVNRLIYQDGTSSIFESDMNEDTVGRY